MCSDFSQGKPIKAVVSIRVWILAVVPREQSQYNCSEESCNYYAPINVKPPLPEGGGGQRPGFELKSFFLVKCPAPGTLQLVKTELPPPPQFKAIRQTSLDKKEHNNNFRRLHLFKFTSKLY